MPPGPRATSAVALALTLAASGSAMAQTGVSLNRTGSGARAAGMGDAFVAVSDDGTAASWNPAGLAQLRQPELSFVYQFSNRSLGLSAARSPDERIAYSSYSSGHAVTSPDFASAALPFTVGDKPVTVQLGWQRVYQLGSRFRGDVESYAIADPSEALALSVTDDRVDGNIDVISGAGAVRLTRRLSVGASLRFWKGGWTEHTALAEAIPGQPTSYFTLDGTHRMRGHNLTLGALYASGGWTFGAVHHAPFWGSYRFTGEVSATGMAPFRLDRPARFRLPRSNGVGVSRRLGGGWTIAAAATQEEWTTALLEETAGGRQINLFDGLPREISTTRDTVSVNAGLEHLVVREGFVIPLRVGAGWEPQGPMDPATRDPVNYYLLAAGAGYNTNRLKLDGSLQYRWAEYRGSEIFTVGTALGVGAGSYTRDAFGRASTQEWRVKVSVIYRIADMERLGEILRGLF